MVNFSSWQAWMCMSMFLSKRLTTYNFPLTDAILPKPIVSLKLNFTRSPTINLFWWRARFFPRSCSLLDDLFSDWDRKYSQTTDKTALSFSKNKVAGVILRNFIPGGVLIKGKLFKISAADSRSMEFTDEIFFREFFFFGVHTAPLTVTNDPTYYHCQSPTQPHFAFFLRFWTFYFFFW